MRGLCAFGILWAIWASILAQTEMSRFEGQDVPKFFVVKSYFDTLHFCYTRPDGGQAFTRALESIGVSRDTPGEGAVIRAMFLAQAVFTDKIDLLPYKDDPEALRKIQLNLLRRQVRKLRGIYGRFLAEIESAGGSAELVENVLEEMVMPNVTITSTEQYPESFLVAAEFEEPDKKEKGQ